MRHQLCRFVLALTAGRAYLIDRPLALADRITEPKPGGKHRPVLAPGQHSGGMLIATDTSSGSILWKNEEDIFGTQIAVSSKHGVPVMYYQAVKHNFFKLPSGESAGSDLACPRNVGHSHQKSVIA